ncbi:HigA family addiction module antitoxin [Novilysobacter arseniciresistens]|nr:HigA family addiction module antitoxin [Lysobacter arseniciresistens]
MNSQTRFQPNYAVAPGAVLDEHRDAAGMTQAELAQRMGFSTKHVNRLLGGQEPVTPETALKLETVFGLPAHVWLGMEARYREHLARAMEEQSLAAELPWLEQLPHRSLAKLGWLPKGLRGTELVRALRTFFGVGSLAFLPGVWGDVQAAYRKTDAFASHEWAMLAWLAQGEREAEAIACRPFDGAALRAALPEIRAMSRLPGIEFVAPLVDRCATLGVVLVLLPAPDGARVCGATRWLTKDKVLVQLSLRYKTDDQLWFTLFHEFGHVLLHGKREQFIDFERTRDPSEQEREANDFAARQLIAPAEMTRFVASGDFSRAAVQAFAAAQGVADGIVVGQLQHRRLVPFASPLSKLKTSFRWQHETRAA